MPLGSGMSMASFTDLAVTQHGTRALLPIVKSGR